mmetsp:Transcript_52751/g.112596  ORF Transcript_52751/g.112596 Transcript_52751/m.112596 type:complete len:209 (-) Transcript_52751:624-1250(-)
MSVANQVSAWKNNCGTKSLPALHATHLDPALVEQLDDILQMAFHFCQIQLFTWVVPALGTLVTEQGHSSFLRDVAEPGLSPPFQRRLLTVPWTKGPNCVGTNSRPKPPTAKMSSIAVVPKVEHYILLSVKLANALVHWPVVVRCGFPVVISIEDCSTPPSEARGHSSWWGARTGGALVPAEIRHKPHAWVSASVCLVIIATHFQAVPL